MLINMGSSSLRSQSLQWALDPLRIDKIQLRYASTITCGLRKPMRTRRRSDGVLSTEAIQAVQSLKLAARNPSKLDQVFDSKLSRLLKDDLLDAFAELQRQQHLDLALKVFEFMKKEAWYEPDQSLYGDMMLMFGKKKLIINVESLFCELIKEGLKPDTRVYTELIGAYLKVDMIEKAMEAYKLMKASGCVPDELTLTIMIRSFESAGRDELAEIIKNDCVKYLDSPKTFLKEVARKYVSVIYTCIKLATALTFCQMFDDEDEEGIYVFCTSERKRFPVPPFLVGQKITTSVLLTSVHDLVLCMPNAVQPVCPMTSQVCKRRECPPHPHHLK